MLKAAKLATLTILFLLSCALVSYSQTDTLKQSDSYVEQGLQAINNKEIDKAIGLFEKAVELNPENYIALTALGGAYSDFKKDYTKGVDYFKKAINLKDDFDMAHFGLGIVYGRMGSKEEAKKEFERTIQVTDKDNIKDASKEALTQLEKQ